MVPPLRCVQMEETVASHNAHSCHSKEQNLIEQSKPEGSHLHCDLNYNLKHEIVITACVNDDSIVHLSQNGQFTEQ